MWGPGDEVGDENGMEKFVRKHHLGEKLSEKKKERRKKINERPSVPVSPFSFNYSEFRMLIEKFVSLGYPSSLIDLETHFLTIEENERKENLKLAKK